MFRIVSVCLVGVLVSCGEPESATNACERVEELTQQCIDESFDCLQSLPMICTYGEVVVETDECACRDVVYQAICDAGVTDSVETIQAGLVCEIVEE